MANHYFSFKQFTIQQAGAAMKVCTDSCLFGALLANLKNQAERVLDIGTGTGLLALMFAQMHPESQIDAIEIDTNAFKQAVANMEVSPWPTQFSPLNVDLNSFEPLNYGREGYDLIFANPPFFEQDLKTVDMAKNKARHSTDLNFPELVTKVAQLLKPEGLFGVLIPYQRRLDMQREAEDEGLCLAHEVYFRQTAQHGPFRSVQFYKKVRTEVSEPAEIIIREESQQYSLKFTKLLRPYYLYL